MLRPPGPIELFLASLVRLYMNAGEAIIQSLLAEQTPAPKEEIKVLRKYTSEARKFAMGRGWIHNMLLEDYEAMLQEQGGVCKICGNAETVKTKAGRVKSLSIDHCHATGMVRGLLCSSCNFMLGAAKDNTLTLKIAVVYLEDAKKRYARATPEEIASARKNFEVPEY